MKILKKYRLLFLLLLLPFLWKCATYYRRTLQFQEYVQSGNFDKADLWLENDSKDKEGKNKLLYLFNRGYVNFILGQPQKSNLYFQQADQLIEDQMKNPVNEALALLSNPMIKPYKPEDFEAVMLHYFTALNYISTSQLSDALVECRRVNIKLNKLNDSYSNKKNRYQRDAFAHLLMGLVYEASRDYNNAFIAYRNAYEIYRDDYSKQFGVSAPQQLRNDLLRTAYICGFFDEVRYYEKEFNTQYQHVLTTEPQLVFFWMNGFGPVKHEWSINFTVLPGQVGYVTFVNEEMGINLPFYIGDRPANERNGFSQLRFLRVAFPKYIERAPIYVSSTIDINGKTAQLQMAENINDIAFKTLHDRMMRELGNSLLRLAAKKALETAASSQNANLGTAVSIANALTEKADTRNWQTLPYSISYIKQPLREGENKITFTATGRRGERKNHELIIHALKGQIYFVPYHTIESFNPVQ